MSGFYYFLWIYDICLHCLKSDILVENNSMHYLQRESHRNISIKRLDHKTIFLIWRGEAKIEQIAIKNQLHNFLKSSLDGNQKLSMTEGNYQLRLHIIHSFSFNPNGVWGFMNPARLRWVQYVHSCYFRYMKANFHKIWHDTSI